MSISLKYITFETVKYCIKNDYLKLSKFPLDFIKQLVETP